MTSQERSKDVFEQLPAYPKPPIVPLPEPGDLESLERFGLKNSGVAHAVAKTVMAATGFNRYWKSLPDHIEGILRREDQRGAFLFSPIVSATIVLRDDPRALSPLQRAATLLCAARRFHDDLYAGALKPDQLHGEVLEMGQYPNLFSTCLVVEKGKPRLFKSTDVTHINVAAARRLYSLDAGHMGVDTSALQLEEALERISRHAEKNRLKSVEPAPGILTCAGHGTQLKVFTRLESDPINRESLRALRHSFLTLCLDLDSFPGSDAEAAMIAHVGNCANRWFHASLQIVIFGNAKACVICNFSAYLDGNTMMRGSAEIQRRAAAYPIQAGSEKRPVSLAAARLLSWSIRMRAVERARQELQAVLDSQQATFEIEGIGSRFFEDQQVPSIPCFILALAMTIKRLLGRSVQLHQFLTMTRYRCMDLVAQNVFTPAVEQFVEYVERNGTRAEQAWALLEASLSSQQQVCREARRYLALPAIFTLFVASRKGLRKWYTNIVTVMGLRLLRLLHLSRPTQWEVLVSHPEIYPETPIVGRPGIRLPYVKYFALHYQIMEERIVTTIMPSVTWPLPNAELVATLRDSLEQIRDILIEHAKPAGQA
jgi:hypothetical protein